MQTLPALILSVIFPHRDLSMNIFSTSPEFFATINDIKVQLLKRTCNGKITYVPILTVVHYYLIEIMAAMHE
jgi:hypothetical protein